jgi:ketosteroid isomerase-like protein
MKAWAPLILVGAVLVAPQWALGGDELLREFEEIERSRSHALKMADLAALDRLYDAAFVGISASGRLLRKADLIENVRTRGIQDTTFTADEIEVRIVDKIALVMGRIVGRSSAGTLVREGRFLHVYTKGEQGWKLVAAQATPIVHEGGGAG